MRRRKQLPAWKGPAGTSEPQGLHELDRFSEASLRKWSTLSSDLDELHAVLYFGLEPERRRLHHEIIDALTSTTPAGLEMTKWVRIVTYQYGNAPLSAAGSLHGYGGRFNLGLDVDASSLNPWPALYIAQDYETAFREKFVLPSDELTQGLTPQELALEHGVSHSTVFLHGSFTRLFDVREMNSLNALAKVLGKIKLPTRAEKLKKKLQIPPNSLFMINTPLRIHESVAKHNWRLWPAQFGLPAPSHILADLVRQAGFEGIIYRSSKAPGDCVAIFPDRMASGSFVELSDTAPSDVKHVRLDEMTASELEGWESVVPSMRPGRI